MHQRDTRILSLGGYKVSLAYLLFVALVWNVCVIGLLKSHLFHSFYKMASMYHVTVWGRGRPPVPGTGEKPPQVRERGFKASSGTSTSSGSI